jgi:hypothetical protein
MKRRQGKNPRQPTIRQTKATSVHHVKNDERQGPKQQKNANHSSQGPGNSEDFVGMDIDLMNYTDI